MQIFRCRVVTWLYVYTSIISGLSPSIALVSYISTAESDMSLVTYLKTTASYMHWRASVLAAGHGEHSLRECWKPVVRLSWHKSICSCTQPAVGQQQLAKKHYSSAKRLPYCRGRAASGPVGNLFTTGSSAGIRALLCSRLVSCANRYPSASGRLSTSEFAL